MEILEIASKSEDALILPLAADSAASHQGPRLPRAPANGLAQSLEKLRLQFYCVLAAIDTALIVGGFAAAAAIHPRLAIGHDALLPAYLLIPLFLLISINGGAYTREGLTDWRKATRRALVALAVSALMFNFFAFFAKANAEFSRAAFVAGLAGAGFGMAIVRWSLQRHIKAQWGPSAVNRLLIEAGGPPVGMPGLYRVDAGKHGLRPDLDDPIALDRLSKYLRNMDMVVVSCPMEDRLAWSEVLRCSGIHGEVISEFAHQIGALALVRHDDCDVTALVVSRGHLSLRSRLIKRLFDLTVAGTAVLVLAPVMLACALAIKLYDGGPVLFRQRRMGRGNQFFDIYKFRSMRVGKTDANGSRSAAKDDDRITRVGRFMRKTSLDELPQLFNVLKGDMSTVGPRPHALGSMADDKLFWDVDRTYWRRHRLRPGITGLAQVRGFRGATNRELDLTNRLEADLEYIEGWSLWGDIRILLMTVRVLIHPNAY